LLAACSSYRPITTEISPAGWQPQEPSLGGWPLGEKVDCGSLANADPAYDAPAIARANLDTSGKSVTSVECHREGQYLRNGVPEVQMRTGSVTVFVFTLSDGTRKAVGVICTVRCDPTSPSRAGA
jgi:hypothetical protein